MPTVTVSSRFRIVIPRQVRQHLGIRPGQQLHVTLCDNRIVIIPFRPIDGMRGFLQGIDSSVEREADRL